MSDLREELINNIWNRKADYYKKANHSSKNLDKFDTYYKLKKYSQLENPYKILDVGCGEGSVISYISHNKNLENYYGIDVSELALNIAKHKHPKINFLTVYTEKIPFDDNKFNLTYTTYTLEHLLYPLITINEMIRVTKNNGYCIFLCPNFGSPIYPSPCYKRNKIIRIINGVFIDISRLLSPYKTLDWKSVIPIIDDNDKHITDHDTTVEPYLLSFVKYIKQNTKHEIIEYSSQWKTINKFYGVPTTTIIKSLPFKLLGYYMHLYPFSYWGPTLFVVIKIKKEQ